MTAGLRPLDPDSIDRLRRLLSEEGCEGLLVLADSSRDGDLAPFAAGAHLGDCFVVVRRDGGATLGYFTDMERDEARATGLELLTPTELGVGALRAAGAGDAEIRRRAVVTALERLGAAPGPWLLAGRPSAGLAVEIGEALAELGFGCRSGEETLRRWRKYKPPRWRARLAEPAEGVCAALRAVARELAASEARDGALWLDGEPLRVARLRQIVGRELGGRGLSEPQGNIFAAGAAAGVPHTQGNSEHVLAPGEPLVVDLFPRGELYADCTRTFCVGDPPRPFVEAHEAVRGALEEAHRLCRPGGGGWAVQERVCDLLEAAGYSTSRRDPDAEVGYVHGLGHGVGYELHEYPSFREHAGEVGRLEIGDLLTLEPGLYDPSAGYGVRLEDLVYLGPEGPVNLTPLPYAWDPSAWDSTEPS